MTAYVEVLGEPESPYPLPPVLQAVAPVNSADDLAWALAQFASRSAAYAEYHAYMRGDHRLTFATRGYKEAFRNLLTGLRCNLCPRVVHALTDRLKLTGFEAHDSEAAQGGAAGITAPKPRTDADTAWALWQDGRLDRHENRVYTEAVATGDAYLLVWPDVDEPTLPRFYPQSADQVVMRYDPERPDVPTLAAKLWREGKRLRLNLYYRDRLEKYRTTRDSDGMGGEVRPADFAPLPAAEAVIMHDYGRVPMFHFSFEGGMGQCGQAELRDIIPLQDALNKELCDLIVASEFAAFPQRWAVGVDPEADGGENAIEAGLGRIISVLNKDAKFGQFTPADLGAYIDTIMAFAELMALAKGLPLHALKMTGTLPSGESLKTAEAPLVSRVEDTQVDFGDVWEDVLAFALRIAGIAPDAQLSAVWRSAVSRAEKDHTETVAVKRNDLGISEKQAWRELGYSDDEIAQMETEKEGEGV